VERKKVRTFAPLKVSIALAKTLTIRW